MKESINKYVILCGIEKYFKYFDLRTERTIKI